MPSIDTFTFTYPIEERQGLKNLLHEWKMEFFYETFIDELITVPLLKIIQERQIHELMSMFPHVPIGIKALFIAKLQKWKNDNPLNHNDRISLNRY